MTTDTFDSNTDASIENYIYDLHEVEIKDTALRDVQSAHKKGIEKKLASDDWQKMMRRIHGTTGDDKRFDDEDINDVKEGYRESGCKPFEIFIKEWGTMQEWGVKDKTDKQIKPAKRYPNASDLRDLCIEIGNFAAASFINETILGGKPIQSPIIISWTERLNDIIEDMDDIIFSEDLVVNEVPHEMLKHITNGFDEKEVLGEGGFSKVYKGLSKGGRKLAIKNMGKAQKKSVNELISLKFSVEKYENLIHPNIIRLYGYSNDNKDEPCLIYPCMENGSLEKYLKEDHLKKTLNAEKRISIILGVAKAISHLHQQTTTMPNGKTRILVHQDIKPGNILLDDKLEPKVADFDLLGFAPTGNTELVTRSSNVTGGSVGYMPPEAFLGRCTAKMDIWALAVVLLQLLTGEHGLDFESGHLMEECRERYENNNSHAPILSILDSCWKESELTIESGKILYDFAMERCLVEDDKKRADIGEVLTKINEAMDLIRS